MDRREVRSILSLHREDDLVNDERFAEAKELAAKDPELAQWWTEDQAIDDAITEKLASIPVPARLRTRLISTAMPRVARRGHWGRPVVLVAAALVLLIVIIARGWSRQ